jgi:hypothetical protein
VQELNEWAVMNLAMEDKGLLKVEGDPGASAAAAAVRKLQISFRCMPALMLPAPAATTPHPWTSPAH